MTHRFDESALTGVLAHMNSDHAGDNLLIAQAFAPDSRAVAATMTGFDGDGGEWLAEDAEGARTAFRVAWPGGSITERPHVRREIVALYEEACRRLGVEARAHA